MPPPNSLETALKKRRLLLAHPEILGHILHYKDLTPTHGTWIKTIWHPSLSHDTLLLAHRNSYKTTSVIIVGVIWYLLFNPNHTILIARKEIKGAASILARIRTHYNSSALKTLYQYLHLSPKFSLTVAKEDTLSLSTKTTITQEGNIEIAGVYTKSITGRHYDRIHTDDIVTEHDRDSANEREKTIRFFQNLKSVIKPGNFITATGTPWHKHDLYSSFPIVHRYPLGSVTIKGFNPETIAQKKKEILPSQFSTQYLLKYSTHEQNLFAHIRYTSQWDFTQSSIAHIDAAFGGDNTSALSIMQFFPNFIAVIGFIFKNHIRTHYPTIRTLSKKYNITAFYLETNADKGATLYDLKQDNINAWGYHENLHKHTKIVTVLYQYWDKIRFHRDSSLDYISQIEDYQEHAKLDDAPDSLASLLVKQGKNFNNPNSSNSPNSSHLTNSSHTWANALERGVIF